MSAPVTPSDAGATRGAGQRWRGRNSLRRKLALTLIAVSLLSVAVLGVLNYLQVRSLLSEQVEEQLGTQGQARARAIREGLTGIKDNVTVLARDPDVRNALIAFSAAFQELLETPDLLDQPQREAMEDFYRESVASVYEDKGFEPPPLADLLPNTDAGQYLQYHYIVQNPFPSGDRDEYVVAEGDSSSYQPAHQQHHPRMRELAATLGFGDLLLIDLQTSSVVHTVEKRIDFGTSLISGLSSESALARAVAEKLVEAPLGTAVLVDFDFYEPASGAPVMFAAAAVRNEGEPIGAVAVTVPIDALNDAMTAAGEWEATGFGDTGESYIVGSDLTMRSDSRLWLEDPDAFLADFAASGYPAETGAFITAFDSTVLLQPVDTEAVQAAFNGERFAGRTANYLGRTTLTVAESLGVEDVSWAVVSELQWSEANDAVSRYTRRMLLTAAILLPIVGLLGLVLADRITRPVDPVVAIAGQVADGDLNVEIPDMGRNEYGDLGRRINTFTADLRAQKGALDEESREVTRLLKSALPDRIVEQVRRGDRTFEDLADSATVIVVTVEGSLHEADADAAWAAELGTRLSAELEAIAGELGIERVRSAGTNHVFVAGLDKPDIAAAAAAQFALRAIGLSGAVAEEMGTNVSFHAGLASGDVVAGLLSSTQLTYAVFGDPPRRALALDSIAVNGQILVDPSTVAGLGTEWVLEEVDNLVDLRGEPITAQLLVGHRAGERGSADGS
jgi:class 3 adenylate cyclase